MMSMSLILLYKKLIYYEGKILVFTFLSYNIIFILYLMG